MGVKAALGGWSPGPLTGGCCPRPPPSRGTSGNSFCSGVGWSTWCLWKDASVVQFRTPRLPWQILAIAVTMGWQDRSSRA